MAIEDVEPNPVSAHWPAARLAILGCSAFVLLGLGLGYGFSSLRPEEIVILGLDPSGSHDIVGHLRGTIDQACHVEQASPLDWPGARYDAVLYRCDKPDDWKPEYASLDEYPSRVIALRKSSWLGKTVFPIDWTNEKDFSVSTGLLGKSDALFATADRWPGGNGCEIVSVMLVWDAQHQKPRFIRIGSLPDDYKPEGGLEFASDLRPSVNLQSNELDFNGALAKPSDSRCCPTGGEIQLGYKTSDGGLTWKLVNATRSRGVQE